MLVRTLKKHSQPFQAEEVIKDTSMVMQHGFRWMVYKKIDIEEIIKINLNLNFRKIKFSNIATFFSIFYFVSYILTYSKKSSVSHDVLVKGMYVKYPF